MAVNDKTNCCFVITLEDDVDLLINSLWPCDAIQWHKSGSMLAELMAQPLPEPVNWTPRNKLHQNVHQNTLLSFQVKCIWKHRHTHYDTSKAVYISLLLCYVMLWFGIGWFTHILQGYFTDIGCKCPSASEGTLKNMGKWITWNHKELNTNPQKDHCVHIS